MTEVPKSEIQKLVAAMLEVDLAPIIERYKRLSIEAPSGTGGPYDPSMTEWRKYAIAEQCLESMVRNVHRKAVVS